MAQERTGTVGDVVANALRQEGCRHVFGLPGSHVLELYGSIARVGGIEHITVKDEANASIMADIYGRLAGAPGVCLLTAGPGAINSAGGVAEAYSANSPMIHITGAVPVDSTPEAFHGVDASDYTSRMFEPITKWSVRVTDPASVAGTMAKAFAIATSGRPGPVHVEFPRYTDTSAHLITDQPIELGTYHSLRKGAIDDSGDRAISEVIVASLELAQRPLICAGKGVLRANCAREVEELSRRVQAPIIYPQDSIGVVPDDHPFGVGYFSIWSLHPFIRGLLEESDLVLAIGVRPETGVDRVLRENALGQVLSVDADVSAPGSSQAVADVGAALRQALQEVPLHSKPEAATLQKSIERYKVELEEQRQELLRTEAASGLLHPGMVIRAMVRTLVDGPATVISDVGDCAVWLRNYLPNDKRVSHLQSGMWNAMGYALPGTLVKSLLTPEERTIGFLGDGAFLMSLSDLGTLVSHGRNATLIVLNDSEFRMIARMLRRIHGTEYGTSIETPDLVSLASSFGATGLRVGSISDLEPVFQRAFKEEGLTVIDVPIRNEFAYPTFEFNTGGTGK